MDKYVFVFNSGAVIIVDAENQIKAIQTVCKEFENLCNSSSFTVHKVTFELDCNGVVKEDISEVE